MISPGAVKLVIRHFDAIDRAVAKPLMYKKPWHEPALTSRLCALLDEETQQEYNINYSTPELNHDLAEMDGLLSFSLTLDTHEYGAHFEGWVTQADLGLLIKFEDELIPSDSWTVPWLLQAKRLYPSRQNPIAYDESCKFTAVDKDQRDRMKELQKIIGVDFIRYLLYCPRPSLLDTTTALKLTHLRNRNLGENIFDFTLGLLLREELSKKDSSLAAGLFVTSSIEVPSNLGNIHERMLHSCFPFSWFLASHLIRDRSFGISPSMRDQRLGGPGGDPRNERTEWAEGIVTGNPEVVECLIHKLGKNMKPFPVLPPHTLTVSVSVGRDLDPETRKIRRE